MFWKRNSKKLTCLVVSVFMIISLCIIGTISSKAANYDDNNGDWSSKDVKIEGTTGDTSEAQLMVRTGDIDNFGFGWGASGKNFDPFSGKNTVGHNFPWNTPAGEPFGLDRIMVASGYNYDSRKNTDGYSTKTARNPSSQTMFFNNQREIGRASCRERVS